MAGRGGGVPRRGRRADGGVRADRLGAGDARRPRVGGRAIGGCPTGPWRPPRRPGARVAGRARGHRLRRQSDAVRSRQRDPPAARTGRRPDAHEPRPRRPGRRGARRRGSVGVDRGGAGRVPCGDRARSTRLSSPRSRSSRSAASSSTRTASCPAGATPRWRRSSGSARFASATAFRWDRRNPGRGRQAAIRRLARAWTRHRASPCPGMCPGVFGGSEIATTQAASFRTWTRRCSSPTSRRSRRRWRASPTRSAGDPLADVPASPRRVVLVGMGSSRYAAGVAALRLRAAGIDAVAEYASATIGWPPAPDTLVVAISASGESEETIATVDRYRGTSPVVALTDAPRSTISTLADVVVPLEAGEERGGVASRSFQHTLLVLRALEARLGGRPVDLPSLCDRVAAATADLLDRRPPGCRRCRPPSTAPTASSSSPPSSASPRPSRAR